MACEFQAGSIKTHCIVVRSHANGGVRIQFLKVVEGLGMTPTNC